MDIAIAPSRNTTQQANTVRSLVPLQLRSGADRFIKFLEDYYTYLNTDGLPSQEIENIVTEHDIDRTSTQYIDRIQKELAKNIPNSAAFDRVSLYKKIYHFYLTKGSEDSILNFFKIFYDEGINVTYPRSKLFKPSAGTWDDVNDTYKGVSGFLSGTDVLQDSHFWQDFSYVINSNLPVNGWKTAFMATTHPAGFEFFAALVIMLFQKNEWVGRFIVFDSATRKYIFKGLSNNFHPSTPYETTTLDDHAWLKNLVPPSKSNEVFGYDSQTGYHFPLFQYGMLPASWTFFLWMPYEEDLLDKFVNTSLKNIFS